MEDRDTIAYGSVEDVFIILHRAQEVAEREWQSVLDEAMRMRELSRVLWVPGKAAPDVGQRHDMITLYEKHRPRIALMSDSIAIDRVATALGWAGIEAKRYGIDDLEGLLAFLDREHLRARVSSALGPYLERNWLVHPAWHDSQIGPKRSVPEAESR